MPHPRQVRRDGRYGARLARCLCRLPGRRAESFGRHYPGIGYADISRSGIYAPVYDLHIRYLAPLGIDDVAEVHTRYVYRRGARLDFEYRIFRLRDRVLCATAESVQLFIDPQGGLLTDLPDYYARWQERFLDF